MLPETENLDQAEEEILACIVSDEELEAAAGREPAAHSETKSVSSLKCQGSNCCDD
jgi:hypothetical protein